MLKTFLDLNAEFRTDLKVWKCNLIFEFRLTTLSNLNVLLSTSVVFKQFYITAKPFSKNNSLDTYRSLICFGADGIAQIYFFTMLSRGQIQTVQTLNPPSCVGRLIPDQPPRHKNNTPCCKLSQTQTLIGVRSDQNWINLRPCPSHPDSSTRICDSTGGRYIGKKRGCLGRRRQNYRAKFSHAICLQVYSDKKYSK